MGEATKKLSVYLNGQIIPAAEASISVADPGLLHGASAFTTMLARNGVVFRLQQHLRRLAETVRLLDLRAEATVGELTDACDELLAANGLRDARVRVTLTPGPPEGRPSALVTADPLPGYPAEWYDRGILVVVGSFRQFSGDPTYGAKTGNYLPRTLARREAAAKGAEEALWFTPDGRLAEACFCNVFLTCEGTLRTPPRDTPVLPGITRQAVLELAGELDIPADDATPLTIHELLAAEEVFITSATMGIRPVVQVERHQVGDGSPGRTTKRLMAAYEELVQRECIEESNDESG